VRTIPYLIAGVLGALALLNLVHQLIVSTHRRRQDIAVLRALGAGSRWVSGVVHWQVSLFTLVVLAVSAPAGIIAGQFVYRAFVDRIGALDTVTLPLALLAAAAVGLVLLANVVATPNAMRARRLPPSVLVED
jgi:predicted lysophospholipase L1 biosynthesis ABC-type transport system permease subunit